MGDHSLPCALTIAGSDSGGGAGIQADLKVFAMHRVYGLSVITALTAQNTLGVHGVFAPDAEFVSLQLGAVLEDFPVRAAKTGMLYSREIISKVADGLRDKDFALVVDPVCVSQSGHRLLLEDGLEAMKSRMMPLATLVTPNRAEAALLADMAEINTFQEMHLAMDRLQDMGAGAVLLKGGHFPGRQVTDWLKMGSKEPVSLIRPRLVTSHTHGTGCTLAAAITACLARGMSMEEAVIRGRDYLQQTLEKSFPLGRGYGPVNHLV